MKLKSFLAELKRRNVYRVAVAYATVGWLSFQIATSTLPVLKVPNWTTKLVIAFVLLGFPIAPLLAWAFELTPEGIKRAEDVVSPAGRVSKNRTWIYVVLISTNAKTIGSNASNKIWIWCGRLSWELRPSEEVF